MIGNISLTRTLLRRLPSCLRRDRGGLCGWRDRLSRPRENSVRTQDLKDRRGVTGEDVKRTPWWHRDLRGESEGIEIVGLQAVRTVLRSRGFGVRRLRERVSELDAPSRLMVTATGGFYAEADGASLECEIRIDGGDEGPSVAPGETEMTPSLLRPMDLREPS